MGLEIIAGVGEKLEFLVKDPAPPCWEGLGGRRCSWWAPEKWDLGIEGLFPLDWEDAQQNQVRDRQGASPDAGEEGTSRVKLGVSLQRAWSLPKERPCKTRLGPCCSELACSAPLRKEL